MFQSDYILRVIEQLGALVRRMLSALREARPEETLELSDEALGLALDLDPGVALALTGEGLLTFMGAASEVDPTQALMVGEVLAARAHAFDLLGDNERFVAESERAAIVLRAVFEHGEDEQVARARELLVALEGGR